MGDQPEAALRPLRVSSAVADGVCRLLQRQVEPEEAPLVIRFAEIFLSKAPPEFLHERSIDALGHIALGAYRFLQRCRPGRIHVEVFNPDVDNEGWYAPVTVVRTVVSERPFIVDTIREFLHSQELPIEHYIYPVLHVKRGPGGRVEYLGRAREGEPRESLVHCEVARVTDPGQLDFLRAEIGRRLQDVVRATDDFGPMLAALDQSVTEVKAWADLFPERREELDETAAFLEWLRQGAFVFLGYRGYDIVPLPDEGEPAIVVEPGSGLGILRNEAESAYADPVPLSELSGGLRQLVFEGPLLIISKTNAEATVHRRARMDYVGVKKLDDEGRVVGERRFIGLFTSKAYAEEAERIPILRQKLAQILEAGGVQEGSHDYKEINTIFNSMPKEELFLASAEEIGADVQTVLTSYHTEDVRVTLRADPLGRGVSVMVILPKERFSGEVRRRMEEALVQRFEAEVLNYHLALGEGGQARLHFYLAASPQSLGEVKPADLEWVVRELIRSWADRVREGLERVRPPDEARRLARHYGDAFSPEYRAATEPQVAMRDILELEAMQADERTVSITMANLEASPAVAGGERVTELKLYLRGERLVLSEFMPILENAGLRVIALTPFDVRGALVSQAIIYAFHVQDSRGQPLIVETRGTLLADTILAVRAGDVTNDTLNQLVLSAGLAWREVDVLRAYATYAFQLRAVPSRMSLAGALGKHPEIARILFDLFRAKFDPEGPASLEERLLAVADIRAVFLQALSGVALLADDRALRRLAELVEATVRTNYYRNGGRIPTHRSGGVPYVSLKFDCRGLEALARSRLVYEVWVRSSRMEGVHLRGSRVARGGIRFSDRPDDFRTEVHGLVKTQRVKNAVIVPGGSKGGFITLRQLEGHEAMARDAVDQYRTLIRGLLDLTDNLRDGVPAPPQGVVCFDEPDPYLVVAADKGTARFSDVANEVAREYDYWLDDAFASGGSVGYDHKAVGITARGAWECVKRHFREKGKDIQREPFTVVGIGDMSGDVFGNGMLLSRAIRLIAAFDHRHVFIDPDPDPESSYRERQRLFALGASSWDDYDRGALSRGGMIVPRGAKELQLTPEACRILGLAEAETGPMDGETLIRAVLRAPVELLWNGGIGTYVKASSESHGDVGDTSNDAVRIDARELRAEVVGEGGNLGLTQRARIEYALAGGRLNTDAIDNSGGVDLSDREVNLKILLGPAVASGRITKERRNELLMEVTDPVAELVLADNESQSLAISLDELRVADGIDDFRDLMSGLEKTGTMDRASEDLPSLETLVERQERGQSMARPELCVLLAYAKLSLRGSVVRSALPDDPGTEGYLLDYFPHAAVREAGSDDLAGHRLRSEIIASQLTNDLVDLMGATFVQRIVRDTGEPPHAVARAWLIAGRLAGQRELVETVKAQEAKLALPSGLACRWLLGLSRVLERTTRWVVANVDPDLPLSHVIEEYLGGLARLRGSFADIVRGEDRALFESRVSEIRELGATEDFARNLITLRFLDQLLEILRVAAETGADAMDAARAYYQVSEVFQVPWLRHAIFEAAQDDRWEQRAAQALVEDLTRAHHRLATHLMTAVPVAAVEDLAREGLVPSRSGDLARFQALLEEIQAEGVTTLPGLSVAVREMMLLAARVSGDGRPRD